MTDVNDNSPAFNSPETFVASLNEDVAVGSAVLVVTATDADQGTNGALSFSLEASPKFEIDADSGLITTTAVFDLSSETDTYSLTVTVRDGGSPTNTDVALVNVTINDVNNANPVFDPQSYEASVPEDLALMAVLVTVNATEEVYNCLI